MRVERLDPIGFLIVIVGVSIGCWLTWVTFREPAWTVVIMLVLIPFYLAAERWQLLWWVAVPLTAAICLSPLLWGLWSLATYLLPLSP